MKKIVSILAIFVLIAGIILTIRFLFGGPEDSWICDNGQWVKHGNPEASMPQTGCGTAQQTDTQKSLDINTPPPTPKTPDIVLLDVPFTSQAPLGQWSDPIYQNACEEASILMADLWIKGVKSISQNEATADIKSISDFEDKNFGSFYDLSTSDTAKLMEEYYNYTNIEVKTNITADDIIQELLNGNLVIVPMNGQELNNPYYTPPGPLEHKILVKGYDFKTDEFITNDCGTRHGENYRYPKDVFFNAIREYPTGYKEPITSIKKLMMVIKK